MSWLDDLRRYPVPGLAMAEVATLRYIAERSDFATGRNSWPSLDTIAAVVGCSVRTVQRAVQGLERRGLLVVVERGDGRRSTVYAVVVDALRSIMRRVIGRGDTVSPLGSHAVTPGVTPRHPTTTETTTVTTLPPVVEQLVLALLETDERDSSAAAPPSARADAVAVAVELHELGATPDDVRCARRAWRELGRTPGWDTPRAVARHWPTLVAASARTRRRAGHTLRAHCEACDGMGVQLDDATGRAGRCPACAQALVS